MQCISGTNKSQEGAIGVIELNSSKDDDGEHIETEDDYDDRDDPEIIRIMVNYMYRYNYYPFGETPAIPDSLITHAKVFATAVKYQVEGLVDLAARRFGRRPKDEYDADEFVACIRFVYDSTPEGAMQLRNIVVNILVEKYDSLQNRGMVEELMDSNPGLGGNVLRHSSLFHQQWELDCKHDRKQLPSWCRQCFLKLPYCRKCCRSNETRPTCPSCNGELTSLDPFVKAKGPPPSPIIAPASTAEEYL